MLWPDNGAVSVICLSWSGWNDLDTAETIIEKDIILIDDLNSDITATITVQCEYVPCSNTDAYEEGEIDEKLYQPLQTTRLSPISY